LNIILFLADPYANFFTLLEGTDIDVRPRTFEESLGTKAESLQIIIHDVPKVNWGAKGEQASKLSP
jgi:hypothetical protein